MILDRNSSNKKSGNGRMSIIFIIIIAVVLIVGAKNNIRVKLQEFLAIPQKGSAINSKEDIEVIVYDFIKANPQVIITSLQDMQKREFEDTLKQAKILIKEKKDDLQGKNHEIAPYAGNKDGDIVIVTFLDYRCGYCKKSSEDLVKLIKQDPNVKVVFKEYPVLGEFSKKLAKTALAVYLYDPSKYFEFHNIIMSVRDPNEQFIQDTLKKMNIDHIKIKALLEDKRIDQELDSVAQLAKEIGVRGTPAFIVDEELIPGAIDFNNMIELIKSVREKSSEKK